MWAKITKARGHKYLQIIHSYRDAQGVPRQKVLWNAGRIDNYNRKDLEKIGMKLLELSGSQCVDFNNLEGEAVVNWGYAIYKRLWEEFELEKIMNKIISKTKVQFSLNDSVFHMVIQHLLEPCSKLKTYEKQQDYLGIKEVELNSLYRSLDLLAENKEKIEEDIYFKNRNLFNMEIDVAYYDVTTFYFESVKQDSIKEFGYSKDCKFNQVQVVMGLFVDCEGRPIGYELFRGNIFDGKTLEKSLKILKERFKIRRVIIVADRGINSKNNLLKLKTLGYGYIVASRLKSMSKEIINEALEEKGYTEVSDEGFKYKVINYNNIINGEEHSERLIITYSEKRAKKDRADRNRLLQKTAKLLKYPSKIEASNKRGGKKYIKLTGNKKWELDRKAIETSQRFDGYYAIQTSEMKVSPKEILQKHHGLWKIEESFRIMKSNLEVRPIFHWTEKRIRGHFVLCFLAFLLERELEFRLKNKGINASPNKIRDSLNSMKIVKLNHKGEQLYLKIPGDPLSNKILSAMKMASPKNVSKPHELSI
jgi:transposase